eukprot:scaffold114216_cov56-Phaeocystis_antarctica.AAC.1
MRRSSQIAKQLGRSPSLSLACLRPRSPRLSSKQPFSQPRQQLYYCGSPASPRATTWAGFRSASTKPKWNDVAG